MSDTFGERMRQARLSRGLSQGQIARAIGVAQTTVGRWERNAIRPSGRRLEALAKVLRTTPAALILGARAATECGAIMPMLASAPAFAKFLDTRIADLQRQVAIARAMREAL